MGTWLPATISTIGSVRTFRRSFSRAGGTGRQCNCRWSGESKRVVPAKLGANPSVASGAPMVNDDLVVESGNGRSLILGKAYRIGRAEEYRDWLRETAPSLGIEGDISDFERPVLVRRRISDVDAGEVRGRRQRGRSGAAFAHGAGGPGREASVRRGPGAAGALGRRDTFREEPGLRGAVP